MWSTSPFERTVIVPPFLSVCSVRVPPWPAATKASAPAARPATTNARRLIPPPSCRCAWVERVADSVAEQVEREHRQEQRSARECEVPPRRAVDRRRVGQHLSPARGGRLNP